MDGSARGQLPQLPRMSRHAFVPRHYSSDDSDDDPDEGWQDEQRASCNLGGSESESCFPYMRLNDSSTHESGVGADLSSSHSDIYFDYFPPEQSVGMTVDDVNEVTKRKNELANDECHLAMESSSIDSPRLAEEEGELESVRVEHVERQYIRNSSQPGTEMTTFRIGSSEVKSARHAAGNAQQRWANDMGYDEAVSLQDDDVDLNDVVPHKHLYGGDARFMTMSGSDRDAYDSKRRLNKIRSGQQSQFGRSNNMYAAADARVNFSSLSRSQHSDYTVYGREAQADNNTPPFGFPPRKELLQRSCNQLMSSGDTRSLRGRLEEGAGQRHATDNHYTRDRSLDSSSKKKRNKKKKNKGSSTDFSNYEPGSSTIPDFIKTVIRKSLKEDGDDSGGEFDVNGNPREDAGSGNDNRLEKYQPSRSNFPSSFPELSNLQHLSRSSREAEAEQRSRHSEKKGGIRAYKESNKNIRTQQKSDQVLGYRGNTEDVEGLVNFIEGGNKKKKKLTPGAAQTNTQNVPVAKTTSKKTKKKAGSGLKAGEADEVKAADEELGEHDVIDDTEKIRAVQEEVDLHVQQVKDMVVNTSQDLQLTNNNNKQKPGRSMSVESNNSIKSTGSKPDSYRQVTPARETAKQRYTPNREMLSLDDNPTHHSSRDPANKMRGNRNNYMFTDTIVSPMPREEEFTVVNKKKKRVIGKEGSVSTPQQNTFHNGGYNNNIGGGLIPAAARYAYTNREHVTRDTTRGRYSPVAVQTPGIQRSVTPPPNLPMNTENTVHVPGQEQRTRERAFSPSGFPVLGGARHHERRNSTGTVPAELTTTGSVDMDSEDVESVKSLPTTVPPVQPKPEQSVGAAGAVSPRAATVSYAKVAAQPRNGSNKPGAASCSDTTLSQKCEDLSTPELAHVQSAPDMAHVDSTNAMGDSNLSSWPPVGAQPATSIVHSDAFVCDNRTEHRIYPTPDLSKPPPPIPTTICSQSPPNFTPIQPHHPHHTTTTTTNLCTATHTVNKTHKFKGGVFINSDLFVPNQTNIGISFGFDMEDDSCVNNSVNNKTSVSTTNFVKIATEPGNGLPLVVASKVVDISPVRTPVSSPPVEMASITDISAIDNGKQDASLRQNIFPPANADDLATGASITFGYVESVCEKTETDVDIEADIDMSPKTEPGKDDTRMPPDGAEGQPEGGDSTQPRTQPRSMSPPPTPVIPILDNDDKKCDTEIIPEPVPPEPPITMPMPPRTPSRSSVSSSGSERTDGGRPHNNHRHRGSSLNNSHNQQDIQAMQQGAQQMQQQAAQFNKGLQNAVNMQHMLNGLLPVQHAMQGAPMFTQHPASAILNYQHAALVAAMAAQNGLHLDPSNMYRPGMPPPTFMPRPHGPPPPHAQPPHMHPQQMQVMPPNSMPGLMGQIPPPHMVMTTHPHQAHIMQAALSAPPPTLPQPPTSLAMPIPPATPPRPHSRSNPPSVEASPVSNNNNDKNKNTQEQENANRDNNQNSCSTEERASSPEQVSSGEPAPNTDIKLASKVKQSPLDWFPEYSSPESDPNFNAGKFNHKDAVTYLSREWDKVMEQKNNYPNSVVYYSEQLHA